MNTPLSIPMDWPRFCSLIAGLDGTLDYMIDQDDEHLRQEAVQQIMMGLCQAYLCLFSQDPQHPTFFSFLNPIIKSAAPNPDYMYRTAFIEGHGSYRVSGNRGTTLFAQLGVGSGFIGVDDVPGPPVVSIDLDEDLTIGPDGDFSLVISPTRPDGYAGDWLQLDPRGRSVGIREASYDWVGERDGVYTIERLDGPATYQRMSAREIADRMERLAGFPERYAKIFVNFVRNLSDTPVNTVKGHDWSGIGGLQHQHYYEGLFDIADDEALILETTVPDTVLYWSVLLADQIFNTIEWDKCQSSLNGHQAQVNADGTFCAVIALRDPGVANWLDPGGRRKGVVQGRWYKASSAPIPKLTRVKLVDLAQHLPADTVILSTEQRKSKLLERFRGAQMRRKW